MTPNLAQLYVFVRVPSRASGGVDISIFPKMALGPGTGPLGPGMDPPWNRDRPTWARDRPDPGMIPLWTRDGLTWARERSN